MLGLDDMGQTLMSIVNEVHPDIQITEEWLENFREDKECWTFLVPLDLQILLDDKDQCLKWIGAYVRMRTASTKKIVRIYEIHGYVPQRKTWTARWVD